MKPKQLEQGSFLYRMNSDSQEMYVLQSGEVEILHYLPDGGEKYKEREFIIERLYRHSIINHNSFIMNDGIDTDARCKTSVSLYYIDINTVEQLRSKHNELHEALIQQEYVLISQNIEPPALDYIIRDPYS